MNGAIQCNNTMQYNAMRNKGKRDEKGDHIEIRGKTTTLLLFLMPLNILGIKNHKIKMNK